MSQIFCFGDSITYGVGGERGGWADLLKNHLHKKMAEEKNERFHIYNLGVPGDTGPMASQRLEQEIDARRWRDKEFILIIGVGTNDSKAINSPDEFISSLEKYRNDLVSLISQAKQHTSKIICLGLTPINETETQPFGGSTSYFSNERIEQFDQVMSDVCSEMKIEKVNFFERMKELDYKKMLFDGLHPNSAGYDWMYKIIEPEVLKFIAS